MALRGAEDWLFVGTFFFNLGDVELFFELENRVVVGKVVDSVDDALFDILEGRLLLPLFCVYDPCFCVIQVVGIGLVGIILIF